jgi:hypothetical protein
VTVRRRGRNVLVVSAWDDDDWVGEPPEGRYSRSRANPGYWRRLRIPAYAGVVLVAALIVLVVVLLT